MMYFIQVILYTAMMLLIYLLFLRNRPFHQLSRYYLLASAILPTFIPHLRMPKAWQESVQDSALFQIELPEVIVNAAKAKYAYPTQVQTAIILYGGIAALFLIWRVWQLYKLRAIIKNGKKKTGDAYTLITGTGYGPGSFWSYIIFPGEEVNSAILAHEIAHVRLKHTEDLVAFNLLQAALWPNLLLIWIKKEIRQIHEFQADAEVRVNKDDYAALLLTSVFNTQSLPAMHLFIIHPIKRRIMMLQKKTKASPMKTALSVAAAFSLFLTAAIGIQSCAKKGTIAGANPTAAEDNIPPELKEPVLKASENAPKGRTNPDNSDIYTFTDKMPEASYDLGKFLSANLKYPEYAKKKKIEGRVLLRFIVKEDGRISDITIVKSPDKSLSDEAQRVVSKMPAWQPGEKEGKKVAVYFTLPIVFKLS